jgi:hypothetical protein
MRTNKDYANTAINYLETTLCVLETSNCMNGMDKVNYAYDMMTVGNDVLTSKLMDIDNFLERIYIYGYVDVNIIKRKRLIIRVTKAINQAIKMFHDLANVF